MLTNVFFCVCGSWAFECKMGSGEWHVEKRSTLRNDSFVKESGSAPETGCLSIVVLGASGDLAKKKTFPALFNLYRQGFLNPDEVHIFGYARTKLSDEELRDRIRGWVDAFSIVFSSSSTVIESTFFICRYLVDQKNADALSKFLQLVSSFLFGVC